MSHLDTAIDLLGDYIAMPTVSCDSNLVMIHALAERLEPLGARIDIQHDETGQKGNLFASLGPQADGGIVLSGHTDVVPVTGQNWSRDPFRMVAQEGRLYGRGSCDMKGFIAAVIAMAPALAARVQARPLHFAFTYDEETGCLGAQVLADRLKTLGVKPGVAIIGEPTMMRVIEGHKGCCEYTTRFQGLAGHGSGPDKGVNAVEYAVRFVSRLLYLKEQLKTRAPRDSRFEPPWTTINTGALHGGSIHNVIPSEASVDWEMRPVHAADLNYVKDDLQEFVADELLPFMRQVHPEADITTETIGEVVGLVPAEDNEARQIISELTGANSADLVAFGTEAGIFQSLGMDVVVCGPGSIEQAHKPDEYLAIDQLAQCLTMLEGLGDKL